MLAHTATVNAGAQPFSENLGNQPAAPVAQQETLLDTVGLDLRVPASLTMDAAAAPSALLPPQNAAPPTSGRRRTILGLYGTYGTLQVLDLHSSLKAVERGGHEANPLMRGVIHRPMVFALTKAAGTTATIIAVEHLWKRRPVLAIATMVGLNVAYVMVVTQNYRTAGSGSSARAPP